MSGLFEFQLEDQGREAIMKRMDFHTLLRASPDAGARESVSDSGLELQELMKPISADEFVSHHFARSALFVPGSPDKFDPIFCWRNLSQALQNGKEIRDKHFRIRACFTKGEEGGSDRQMIPAYFDQLPDLLHAGATVCVTNIHIADPWLHRWAQAIQSQVGFFGNVGVNCYISPNESGFPTHYDARVATSLQISGLKRWRFSLEPAKHWPTHNASYHRGKAETMGRLIEDPGKLPPELTFQEVLLGPGDLLCLPAGAWHSARAEGHSLAINLYFERENVTTNRNSAGQA